MTFFGDLSFYILLVVCCIPAIVLKLKEKDISKYILVLSLIFIFEVYKHNVSEFLWIILYFFIEWHVVFLFLVLKKRWKERTIFYHYALAFSILPLIIYKIGVLVNISIFGFLGISYLTFKTVQIVIEIQDELIQEVHFLDYANFILFFPTISSGPIDRSRRFQEDLHAKITRVEYMKLLEAGCTKIALGLIYKFALSVLAFQQLEKLSGRYAPIYLFLYAILYALYMFFDFAGYSLLAIGTSYILGIKSPENFNKPFLSVDIKDFWNRWHISLSHWFRDFIFSRYMMNAIMNQKYKKRENAAAAGYIINMGIMGLWHGITPDYILYGLYHGVLLALNGIYEKKFKFYKRNKNKTWYCFISWFVTMLLILFGFLIFSGKFLDTISVVLQLYF